MTIPSHHIIGLCANRGVGKDTFCKALEVVNDLCMRFAFADALKEALHPFLVEEFDIDPTKAIGADKEFIRPMLIAYGCMWRERDIDHWAKAVEKDINRFWTDPWDPVIPVITDVRFLSEAELFRRKPNTTFTLVNLTRDGAPEPTDEEKKNYPALAATADIHFHLPSVKDFSELKPLAWHLLNQIGLVQPTTTS